MRHGMSDYSAFSNRDAPFTLGNILNKMGTNRKPYAAYIALLFFFIGTGSFPLVATATTTVLMESA